MVTPSQNWSLDYDALYEQFRDMFPEISELGETPQDSEWHAEGDVATHTRMVLDELSKCVDDSIHHLPSVILGSFFHDIGKVERTKTRRIDGEKRIVSPGHARAGRSLVGRQLIEELPWDCWWRTIQLIGFHHEPRRVVNIDAPEERLAELQWLDRMVDLHDLYTLCLADTRGRQCDDRRSRIETLQLFALEIEEGDTRRGRRSMFRDTWDPKIRESLSSYPEDTIEFVQAEARFSAGQNDIHHWKEALSQSYQYRDEHPKLILLCGLSGSGKTTWRKRHPSDAVISLDRIRAEIGDGPHDHSNEGRVRQRSKTLLKRYLARGDTVIWDATNYRRDFRRPLIQLGYQYGAFVTMKVFCTPQETCKERSKEWVVDKQFDAWQLPLPDECHTVEYLDMEYNTPVRCLGGECIDLGGHNETSLRS